MNKRLVLLNPKFVNQKRVGTAPELQGRPLDQNQQFNAMSAGAIQSSEGGVEGAVLMEGNTNEAINEQMDETDDKIQ